MSVYFPTVGRVLNAFEHAFPNDIVYVDVDGAPMALHHPHSYRGSFDELAFSVKPGTMTVGELRELLEGVLGQSFEGWKGGQYVMGHATPIHVADVGETGKPLGLRVSEYDRATGITTYRFIMHNDDEDEYYPY